MEQIQKSKEYRLKNPEKVKWSIINATYKSKYKITLDEYNEILKRQNFSCAVCDDIPTKQRLHVDHNHITGKVRGLLCQPCNVSIGKMKENPNLLRKLADYIEFRNDQNLIL